MDLDRLGRFAEPAVLILSSLAGGDKHGYALIKDIEAFADVTLGPGTLYGALTPLGKTRAGASIGTPAATTPIPVDRSGRHGTT